MFVVNVVIQYNLFVDHQSSIKDHCAHTNRRMKHIKVCNIMFFCEVCSFLLEPPGPLLTENIERQQAAI